MNSALRSSSKPPQFGIVYSARSRLVVAVSLPTISSRVTPLAKDFSAA
jgi:hypothetical protein